MASGREAERDLRSVVVVGAGYVGLPLCLLLARAGIRVTAVDVDETVVREINQRSAKIEEEDFESFFRNPVVEENLWAQAKPAPRRTPSSSPFRPTSTPTTVRTWKRSSPPPSRSSPTCARQSGGGRVDGPAADHRGAGAADPREERSPGGRRPLPRSLS